MSWRRVWLCLLAAAAVPAVAQVTCELQEKDGSPAMLVIHSPPGTTLSVTDPSAGDTHGRGGELLLTSDVPLGTVDVNPLSPWIGPVLKDVRYGYDTLLLVFQPAVAWRLEMAENTVTVHAAAVSAGNPDRSGERLDYLRAVSALESGDLDSAQHMVQRYRHHGTDDKWRVLAARIDAQRGQWRSALQRLGGASDVVAAPAEVEAVRRAVRATEGNRIGTGLVRRRVEGRDTQWIHTVHARALINAVWRTGLSLERRDVDAGGAVRHPDGELSPLDAHKRYVAAWVEWGRAGHEAQGTVYINPGRNGAQLDYTMYLEQGGSINAALATGSPFTAYVEGIVGDATRDFVSLAYGRSNERFTFRLRALKSRYRIDGAEDTAGGLGLNADASLVLIPSNPRTALHYMLDWEDISHTSVRSDEAGDAYEPLPLADRRVNAVGVEINDALTDGLSYTMGLGYSFDSNNLSAPFAGAELQFNPAPGLTGALTASRTASVERREDRSVTEFGARVQISWY